MPVIVMLPGIAAYVLYKNGQLPQLEGGSKDGAYAAILSFLAAGLKGLSVAALTAAIVASLAGKLNSISTIYTLDIHKMTRNTLRDVQLVLSGENLLLWKKYNGFDPDVSSESGTSTLRRLDIGAYPKPRTITASVQIRY
mgnify:CR=1 FL=1